MSEQALHPAANPEILDLALVIQPPQEGEPKYTDPSMYVECDGLDPEAFLLPVSPKAVLQALEVCKGCPAREPCVDYAVENSLEGVWGGLTTHSARLEYVASRSMVEVSISPSTT